MSAAPGRAPYRQLPPPAGAELTMPQLRNEMERIKWRERVIVGLLTALILLLAVGAAVWLGILTGNENNQQATLNAISTNVSIVQQDLMQLILEMNGNVTVLQRGTVQWTLAKTNSYPNPACATPAQYVNQGSGGQGSLISGTYILQNVQVGALNFTMVVLSPPAEHLTYTYTTDISGVINVCVVNFTPTVNILDSIIDNANGGIPVYQFTSSNLARIISTPDCLLAGTCYIMPYWQEWYTGDGAYSVQQTEAYPGPGDFFLEWSYSYSGGPAPALGTNYTIIQPLQLVLPSS